MPAPPPPEVPVSSTTHVPRRATRLAREGVRLVASFVREQPVAFGLASVGSIAFTGAIVASALVVGWITDEVVVPVLVDGEPAGPRLRTAALLVLAVAVWKAGGIVIRRSAATWLQARAQQRLRSRLIRHLLRLTLGWYGRRSVGDLLSVSDADTRQTTFVLAPLPLAAGVGVLLVAASVVVLVTDPLLGLLAMLLLVLVAGIDLRGAWLTFAGMEEVQRRRGVVAGVAHESFDGALTVKALGREDVETDRFRTASHSLRDQFVAVGRLWTIYRAITEVLPAAGIVVILVVGVVRIAAGGLTPGELVRVAYLLSLLAVPMRMVGYLLWDMANSVAGWRRVREVLHASETVPHGPLPAAAGGDGAGVAAERVTFGYDDAPVLHHLDLEVPPGRTVAVVGPTASGKSTLALLLARLWDPQDGAIRLAGRDLRDLTAGAVPEEVAYVAQDTFLFDDTVLGNVTLGDDRIGEDDVWAALRVAGADRFVAALHDGLDTRIGERGATLSGGQQQRIALARALVRRPRLLVLDDATSAVDPSVEAAILRRLTRAELPSTVVLVAYRRSSIVLADEVVYLEAGRVVAHGRHHRLLRDVPGYAALLQAYEEDAARRHAEADLAPDGRRDAPPAPPDASRGDEAAGRERP